MSCTAEDNSFEEQCGICTVRTPAFREALKHLNEQIALEEEMKKVYILSIYDNNSGEHVMDHVLRKRQEAINYFEVHYNALRYNYKLEHTELDFSWANN